MAAEIATVENPTQGALLRAEIKANVQCSNALLVCNMLRLWELGHLKKLQIRVARRSSTITAALIKRPSAGGVRWQLFTPDSQPCPDLEHLIDEFVDWRGGDSGTEGLEFPALPESLIPLLGKVASRRGWSLFYDQKTPQHAHYRHRSPKVAESDVAIIGVPAGFEMIPVLDPQWAGTMDAVWPYRSHFSKDMIRQLLKNGLGIGILQKSSVEPLDFGLTFAGDLAAWYLTNEYGCQGLLNVRDSHRRRGLASSLLAQMRLRAAELDLFEVVVLLDENLASNRLYHGHGFKRGEPMAWLMLRKPPHTASLPPT